jgi:hypothetical protein
MLSRRTFLKFGLAGGLLLAAAGAARSGRRYVPASGAEPLAVLAAGDRVVLAAIVPVLLEGAGAVEGNLDAVVGSVDRAVTGLPPHLQAEVKQLLALLGSWPGRRLLAGVRAPWSEANRAEIAAFLERWRFSGWRLQQQAYQALHELVFAAWYARPDTWPAIGYPGPPVLR